MCSLAKNKMMSDVDHQ